MKTSTLKSRFIYISGIDHSSCWTVNCFPKRICALKGSSLNISCEYSHSQHQQPIMKRWLKINRNINQKEEEIIENKYKVKFYDSPNKHNLRFEKLSKSDSGEYVFEIGENSNELKESTFPEVTLIVTGKYHLSLTEGQKVTLTCSTSCPLTPNSNFHWYLNHQPLKVENKHLVIDAVTSQDAGNYSCVVKTKEIFMSSVKTLTVKSINPTSWAAVVGRVSAVVLVSICLAAVFLGSSGGHLPNRTQIPQFYSKLVILILFILIPSCMNRKSLQSEQQTVNLLEPQICKYELYYQRSRYTDWPKKKVATKKKGHTYIIHWTAFSFDYGTHSLWHCFDKLLQCHKIYFHPVHSFFTKILH
uniref:Ig-like domain-containing protein n=1 Tax=Oryzias melastigma TaxID=30732 RepID=A0A3B3CDN0_ORYME